ncbi:MAG TPA: hypothetical protein VGT08_13180 [Terracidiphilus sp.]|nr:hypothetical protein [Terracidiphilus sp.]
MFRRISLVWIALSLIGVPACLAATSVEKIRNEKVIVTEDTLAQGETASFAGNRPGMIVFLYGNKAAIIPGHGQPRKESVKRGDTLLQSADEKSIRNEGSSALSFVRIEFLAAGLNETWGMTGLSPNYKLLLENQYARAYDIRIPAQAFEPQHTHHDRVVVCLAGAKLEHILPNGEKQPSTLKTGEVVWRLGATHIGHNMDHSDLWVIAIEPK